MIIQIGVPTTTTTAPQQSGQEEPAPDTIVRGFFLSRIRTALVIRTFVLVVFVFDLRRGEILRIIRGITGRSMGIATTRETRATPGRRIPTTFSGKAFLCA